MHPVKVVIHHAPKPRPPLLRCACGQALVTLRGRSLFCKGRHHLGRDAQGAPAVLGECPHCQAKYTFPDPFSHLPEKVTEPLASNPPAEPV